MKLSELIDLIKNNDIAIYGTGFVAQNFYAALQMRNLERKVKYFIVTDAEKAYGVVQNVPVRAVNDIVNDKNILVCIAVHEAIKEEIEMVLLEWNIYNFVWIHPYIVELVFGAMKEYHRKMKVSKLILDVPYNDYALAMRYLVIENYYKENDMGYDIYVRILSGLCEAETAKKRLKNFIKLIADWDINGYREEKNISIDENNRCINGAHRLSLACYHRMEYIYCDIYPYSNNYSKYMGRWIHISKDVLKDNGLNSFEISALERANAKLREKCGI